MLKCMGLTALATVVVVTLGRLVSPTAAAEDQIYTAVPVPAEVIASEVTVLWRDIGIYRTSGPLRMAGPIPSAMSRVASPAASPVMNALSRRTTSTRPRRK